MKIKIITFSSVKSICNFAENEFEIQNNSSVGDLLDKLYNEYTDLSKLKDKLLFAKNEEYCNKDTMLADGDVISIFPPVSGG